MRIGFVVRALLVATVVSFVGMSQTTFATALKLSPLEYRTSLKSGERQKGSVDVSNPTDQTLRITTSVRGFRQIDNKGSLEFFKSIQLEKGIQLDLSTFALGPHEALRMYFILDGKKLPSGDVYGAIFFSATPPGKENSGVQQAVRVGTLLSVINGTPGVHTAEVTTTRIPFFQIGTELKGSYTVKNTADPAKNTGFYPEINVKLWPGNTTYKSTSSLLFAGRSRSNDFTYQDIGFGLHRISVAYGSSSRSAWVFTSQPFVLLVLGLGALVVLAEYALWKKRRNKRKSRS